MPDRFSVFPDPFIHGGILTISFRNEDLVEKNVAVVLNNGKDPSHPGYQKALLQIRLWSTGHGSRPWRVPESWDAVVCEHPSSADHWARIE